jgi:hypothetical protein
VRAVAARGCGACTTQPAAAAQPPHPTSHATPAAGPSWHVVRFHAWRGTSRPQPTRPSPHHPKVAPSPQCLSPHQPLPAQGRPTSRRRVLRVRQAQREAPQRATQRQRRGAHRLLDVVLRGKARRKGRTRKDVRPLPALMHSCLGRTHVALCAVWRLLGRPHLPSRCRAQPCAQPCPHEGSAHPPPARPPERTKTSENENQRKPHPEAPLDRPHSPRPSAS